MVRAPLDPALLEGHAQARKKSSPEAVTNQLLSIQILRSCSKLSFLVNAWYLLNAWRIAGWGWH
jgi:hypothetical protein